METASDSLHDVRDWKKVFKNLGNHVINLLYKQIFMIKWIGFEFKNFKLPQAFFNELLEIKVVEFIRIVVSWYPWNVLHLF